MRTDNRLSEHIIMEDEFMKKMKRDKFDD